MPRRPDADYVITTLHLHRRKLYCVEVFVGETEQQAVNRMLSQGKTGKPYVPDNLPAIDVTHLFEQEPLRL